MKWDSSIDGFSPLVQEWLRGRFPGPTDAQRQVWPRIVAGESLLLASPTGTGKTLAAFLCGLDALLSGRWPAERLALLYISPLKALNQDVRLNLLEPLNEIRELAEGRNQSLGEIRIETRSGDTSQYRRRRMIEKPPQILITTPESLNIMLANPRARLLFSDLKTVILDEIHALASNKRGVHLVSALERLSVISGEFQRLALSATVANPERVAAFAAGYAAPGLSRAMGIVRSADRKQIRLEVEVIPEAAENLADADRDTPWKRLVEKLLPLVEAERSTLIFVNSRRLAERLSFLLNTAAEANIAYAHHGSLSREIRQGVETRMKSGRLRCIVATNSLELGIDIGFLDQIILVQTPFSLASAVQKIGRAGHRVGAVSRARLFCSHGRDLLDGLGLARAVQTGEVEELKPVEGGLDVLAQIIVSEAMAGPTAADGLFRTLRRSYPFRNLERDSYDLVLEMLSGYYRGARIPKLPARIKIEGDQIHALPGAAAAYYSSGGTIPDRGYFTLRKAGSGTPIGELDEEFVWERKVGDVFSFGNRMWRIQALTPQTVEVLPSDAPADTTTFFRADPMLKGYTASAILGELIEAFGEQRNPERRLTEEFAFSREAAERLSAYLKLQTEQTGPVHRHRIVEEETRSAKTSGFLHLYFLHTLWGGTVNAPLALALSAQFAEEGVDAEVIWDNDSILISSLDALSRPAGDRLASLSQERLEGLIVSALSRHGIFGARFREAAGRALLLPKSGFNRRTPLWLNRLRAQRLYGVLVKRPDFPLIREALRECMQDLFDIPRLKELLRECTSGIIEIGRIQTESPSPLCSGALWDQINVQVYNDDTPAAEGGVSVEWAERIASGEFERPRIDPALIEAFLSRLQRRAAGYRPESGEELQEILKERILIPIPEWREMAEPLEHEDTSLQAKKFGTVLGDGRQHSFLAAGEQLPYLIPSLRDELTRELEIERHGIGEEEQSLRTRELFSGWLYFLRPVSREELITNSPFDPQQTEARLDELIESEELVFDRLIDGDEKRYLMHAEAYRELLSFVRARHRIDSGPLLQREQLARLLYRWQGAEAGLGIEEILSLMEGFPLPARLWEEAVLPVRSEEYRPARLDEILSRREICWLGEEKKRISFYLREDADLCGAARSEAPLLPAAGAFSFWELTSLKDQEQGRSADELAARLWKDVWNGGAAADSFAPIRSGIARNFRAPKLPAAARSRRRGFAAWRSALPLEGNWYRPALRNESADELETLEASKERVRILFSRYPVLFRELLHREEGPFRWGAIFKALRLMEFSGELISGEFIAHIPGLQFILKEDLGRIRSLSSAAERPFLLHVADPASLAGIGIDALKQAFPERRGELWMLIREGAAAAWYSKSRADLHLGTPRPPEEEILSFRPLLKRGLLDRLDLETVNSIPIYEHPAAERIEEALLESGFVKGLKAFTLWP